MLKCLGEDDKIYVVKYVSVFYFSEVWNIKVCHLQFNFSFTFLYKSLSVI